VKGSREPALPSIPSPTRPRKGDVRIGAATAAIEAVIAADEERMIARQTWAALAASNA
jgi:hypothetical protein